MVRRKRLIRKRDGRVVSFRVARITSAISRAMEAAGKPNPELSRQLASIVSERVRDAFTGSIPGVEDVQDMVERVLIEKNLPEVAKAYILYRQKRAEIRDAKALLGIRDELKLTVNAANVLKRRYLRRDAQGRVIETPAQMFRRVARVIARAERLHDANADVAAVEKRFLDVMTGLYFIPNSPTLMNAGTRIGQLSACFVIPVEDSIKSIFRAVRDMALIHQSGGGTGFSFSRLRPAGDIVQSTRGIASGPVSFMRIFDVATDVVKQGGRRRGANMGVLSVDHPDILQFITAKEKEGVFTNFNLSVGITDEFMRKVKDDEEYDLINPRTGGAEKTIRARDVFELMISTAWRTGDPGIIFLDEVNRHNPTPELGRIEATNPCGEVPLLPYESCTLGSINLSKVVKNGEIDWDLLGYLTRTDIHFLDNVLDVNKYPIAPAKRMADANRKIGLGVMGFAELLIKLGIAYNSEEGLNTATNIMRFIEREGRESSRELGEDRGVFPNFEKSMWAGGPPMRNATITTIAPTGTISIIAGTSSGIEPLFAVAFVRRVMGTQLIEVNPVFEQIAKDEGFYSKELMRKIARAGSVRGISEVPERIQRLFVTALEVEPEWHVRMQATFQQHVENAVSKTVNLPQQASLGDVRKVFEMAYSLHCKGITVYRYGSRSEQVLYTGEGLTTAQDEYSGGCPTGECAF